MNKEVFNQVADYIKNNIDCSGYDNEEKSVQNVFRIFKSEYQHQINRLGKYKAFNEWLMGLPSCISIDFEYYKVNQIMYVWGFEGDLIQEIEPRGKLIPERYKVLDNHQHYLYFLDKINYVFFQLYNKHEILN